MKSRYILENIVGALPFRMRQRRAAFWILPASIGLGVGAALGVGIGMVLAPRSGRETRERIRTGAYRLGERARHVRRELRAKADGVVEALDEELHQRAG